MILARLWKSVTRRLDDYRIIVLIYDCINAQL